MHSIVLGASNSMHGSRHLAVLRIIQHFQVRLILHLKGRRYRARGCSPVMISHKMTPKLKMSAFSPQRLPISICICHETVSRIRSTTCNYPFKILNFNHTFKVLENNHFLRSWDLILLEQLYYLNGKKAACTDPSQYSHHPSLDHSAEKPAHVLLVSTHVQPVCECAFLTLEMTLQQ